MPDLSRVVWDLFGASKDSAFRSRQFRKDWAARRHSTPAKPDYKTCTACDGSGKWTTQVCGTCLGKGIVEK